MNLITKLSETKKLKQQYTSSISTVESYFASVVKKLENLKKEYLTPEYISNPYNKSMIFYKLKFLNDAYKKFVLEYSQFKHFNNININKITNKKLLADIQNTLNLKTQLRQMFEQTYIKTKKMKKKVQNPVLSINKILTHMIDAFDFNSTAYKTIYNNPTLATVLFYS